MTLANVGVAQSYRAQLELSGTYGLPGGDAATTGLYAQPVNLFAQASGATGGGATILYNLKGQLAVGLRFDYQSLAMDAFGASVSLTSIGGVARYHLLPLTSRLSPYVYAGASLVSGTLTQDAITVEPSPVGGATDIQIGSFERAADEYSLESTTGIEAGVGFLFSLNDKLGLQGSLGYFTAATSDSEVLQSVYPTSTGNLTLIQVRAGLFFKLSRRR